MRYIIFILILLGSLLKAQTDDLPVSDSIVVDNGQKDSIQIFNPTIDDYQFFTQFSQRKVFDTVFTIGNLTNLLSIIIEIILGKSSLRISEKGFRIWFIRPMLSRI